MYNNTVDISEKSHNNIIQKHVDSKTQPELELEPIDLPTTYFWEHLTAEICSLYKCAETILQQKPQEGFGYIPATSKDLEKPSIAKQKRVILTEQSQVKELSYIFILYLLVFEL